MRKYLCGAAAAVAAIGLASPASAATMLFTPGGSVGANLPAWTVINAFETDTGVSGTVNVDYKIKSPPSDGEGAVIPNSTPAGTNYLSVLGGGTVDIALPGGTTAFAFDWGSLDTYNTLRVFLGGGGFLDFIPGGNIPSPGNGNQFLPNTNGLFQLFGDPGETFTSLQLTSNSNSFEIDNLAVAPVPEPATWLMLILGFGLVGGVLRRREHETARIRYDFA